jgi:hypothetical protein
MALDAMANDPSIDVKIIPIGMMTVPTIYSLSLLFNNCLLGLNYFHPDQFRSRAVVSFGQPILIARAEVEKYKAGGVQKREAVTNLIRAGRQALMTVTVNSPDYETLKVRFNIKMNSNFCRNVNGILFLLYNRLLKLLEDYIALSIINLVYRK